jgi:hypothetical protein
MRTNDWPVCHPFVIHVFVYLIFKCFHSTDKYQSQFGGGGQYSYNQEDDESSYQLVDTARTVNKMQRGRLRIGQVFDL